MTQFINLTRTVTHMDTQGKKQKHIHILSFSYCGTNASAHTHTHTRVGQREVTNTHIDYSITTTAISVIVSLE